VKIFSCGIENLDLQPVCWDSGFSGNWEGRKWTSERILGGYLEGNNNKEIRLIRNSSRK
jgi:hypothetical protein